MNNFQYFRKCLHVLWLKARVSRGYRNISLHLVLLCFVRFFFSYRHRQKMFLFCFLKNSTSLWKRCPINFLRFCFARRSPYIQTTRRCSYPEYILFNSTSDLNLYFIFLIISSTKKKVNNNPTKISLIKFSSFSSSSKYDRSSKILKHNYLQHIWSYLNQSKKYYIETSDDFNSLQSIHAESNLFNNLRVHSIIPYFLFHQPELSNQTFSTMIKNFTRPEKSFKTLIQHDVQQIPMPF